MVEKLPGALGPDPFPLTHSFAHGLYARQIDMPAGYLIVTKIHKRSNVTIVLKGKCSMLEEGGVRVIEGPQYFITPAGTMRALYTHEDSTWLTVHATTETEIDKVEDYITAKSFAEVDETAIADKLAAAIKRLERVK
jgi:quercetin dioxygenase-like cupin family protein